MKSIYCALLAAAPAFAGTGLLPSTPPRTSGWTLESVSAGTAWRSFGSVSYRGGSRAQDIMVPSLIGGDSLTIPAIGEAGAIGNRTYNDGFVNLDSTGGADTWNWGYESAGQAQAGNLVFSATGQRSAFSQASSLTSGGNDEDDLTGLSPQVDFLLRPPTHWRVPFDGILASFWFFSDETNNRFSNFEATQNRDDFRLDFTDRYDFGGIILPDAPYTGSANGPGPLIPNLPSDRERVDVPIGSEQAVLRNQVRSSFEINNFSIALGPTKSGAFGRGWHWQASAGITLNVFKWNAKQTETLTASVNGVPATNFRTIRDSNSGTDFRLGVFAKGEIIRELQDGWFVKGYLQGELADSLEIKVGESRYELEPGGYAVGLSVGRKF